MYTSAYVAGLSMELQTEKNPAAEIRQNLLDKNFKEAFSILKRNPMATISRDDARLFLNNLGELSPVPTLSLDSANNAANKKVYLAAYCLPTYLTTITGDGERIIHI